MPPGVLYISATSMRFRGGIKDLLVQPEVQQTTE